MKSNFTLANESWRGTRKTAADVRYQTVRLMARTYLLRPEHSARDSLSRE